MKDYLKLLGQSLMHIGEILIALSIAHVVFG